MKAAVFDSFGGPIQVSSVPDPVPAPDGLVIRVMATGLCRSDWHAWMGHDPDVRLPHVPGHELAGVVGAVGANVRRWKAGDRVTVPFVCGCGTCPQCLSGNQQVCDHQSQPGFTHWGSFAEYVAIDNADLNAVRLPEGMDFVAAASLGCRFVTSFRALVDQARARPGEWVAVHGCGGVGLSAIMIAKALGANVVAIDIAAAKLAFARKLGADATLDSAEAKSSAELVSRIDEVTGGGAHVSIDALGSPQTCFDSVSCLRKRGRHVQIGLLLGEQAAPAIPMDKVVGRELEILGSHGIQAHRYPALFAMIISGALDPAALVGERISLTQGARELTEMDSFKNIGVTVIDRFT
jgi:alcohol dehydrogenase